MAFALKKATLSPENYLAAEAESQVKHEYVDGQVFVMAGASERHKRIAMNIAFHLRAASRGTPCGAFMSNMKLRSGQRNRLLPPPLLLPPSPQSRRAHGSR